MSDLIKGDWYSYLIIDLHKLEYEGIIITKWNIGKRILEDFEKFGKPEYGSHKIEHVAKDMDTSRRDIYCCIQFAEKCDDVTQFIDRSWRWITHEYLPEHKEQIEAPPLPEGKYFVLYADPPWQYDNTGFDESAQQHYQTMSVTEICELPVMDLVDIKTVLFLWVTNAFLQEGLDVCKAWGFEYKTNFAWIKNAGPSMGWYTKSRHELLFIATRGSGVTPDEKMLSWFEGERSRHSKKPDKVYEMIETMYTGPYIELFARQAQKGWHAWGNEVPKNNKDRVSTD